MLTLEWKLPCHFPITWHIRKKKNAMKEKDTYAKYYTILTSRKKKMTLSQKILNLTYFCLWSLFTTVLLFPLHLVFIFVRTLSHCSINEGESNLWRKIYVAAILTHESWNFTMLNIQHVLAWYYLKLIALVLSHQSLKKRNIFYSTTELSLLFRLLWTQRRKHGKTGLPWCTR